MPGRRVLVATLAASILAALASCGGSRSAAVFRPAGALSPAPTRARLPAQAVLHLGGFRFPAGVSIDFSSPAPAGATARAVISGYEGYVLSLWAAVLSHGTDTAYRRQDAGNAVGFVRREAARYRSAGATVRGTIRYYGTRVAGVYFSTGANVISCVDASAFRRVDAQTGATMGPALPARLAHYLENVAEGRRPDGAWFVTRLAIYPASSPQGAMCR